MFNMSPEQNLLNLNVDFWHSWFSITKSPYAHLIIRHSKVQSEDTINLLFVNIIATVMYDKLTVYI